jgi:hypothetical protein
MNVTLTFLMNSGGIACITMMACRNRNSDVGFGFPA